MSVKAIQTSLETRNNNAQIRRQKNQVTPSFKGTVNPVVGLMDFIDKGGFAASFIIQDGLGFIAPRVGKGILRGGKEKKDENGNPILDKNGKPKHEYNWEFARKEGLREVLTGPSAFLIPLGMLSFINRKFGTGNSVKLNYLDSFNNTFTEFAKENIEDIKAGNADNKKLQFYEKVHKDTLNQTINAHLPEAERISDEKLNEIAKDLSERQIKIEEIKANKSLNKKQKAAKIGEIGSIEDSYMKLIKSKMRGNVNELAVQISSSNGSVKHGSISELLGSMNNYFGDAVNNTKAALKKNTSANIEEVIKKFTNRRMGTRFLTNMSMYGAVVAFYTVIPKLYNLGLKGNPGLKGTAADPELLNSDKKEDKVQDNNRQKDIAFKGGMTGFLEKTGEKVFNGKKAKAFSNIFEFNGPVIPGTAMATLLYAFCIPPRLVQAQDKYDRGEIIVRDVTSFTALLFGAKALARLFSDGFTKLTGLALNKKDMDGRNVLQRIGDYLNPNDSRHSLLSSKQLDSKYTNIKDYKGGVNGFMEFIEDSGGNLKKAFAQDKNIKESVENILKDFNGKSYKDATADEIKEALKAAHNKGNDLINKFYKLFESENGLLKRAKTCNSAFSFLSTLILVPSLIIWLTNVCEKMTAQRTAKDFAEAQAKKAAEEAKKQPEPQVLQGIASHTATNKPSMAGFIGK